MTRKDSEKETDRPHYYSQFWLDVAAGRTVIGAAKSEDETDLVEETERSEAELEPTPLRRAGRNQAASTTDGHKTARTQTVIEPEEFGESEQDEFDLTGEVEDLELPDTVFDETEEETIFPEEEMIPDEEVMEGDEEEPFFDEELEDEDEDEDEDEWGSRGRKKPKPGRQAKTPKSTKKPKRDSRRGY